MTVKDVPLVNLVKVDESTGLKILPHWLAQPYFRPLPPSTRDMSKGMSKSEIYSTMCAEKDQRCKGRHECRNRGG